jgi:PKD repeat protein
MNAIRYRTPAAGVCLGLLLALGLLLLPRSAQAGRIEEAEVRAAVETWLRYATADARRDAVVERMEPYQVDGETVAYIAHLEGGGFCLGGADDLLLPVYFYSPRGTYDPENPNYQYVLWEIGARLKALRKGLAEGDSELRPHREALSDRAGYWQALIAGRVPGTVREPGITLAEPISMHVPLVSQWDQGSPYNDQCPELTPGADEHAVVGCNATATAQIMYYWKWPPTGVGEGWVTYDYWYRTTWDSEPLAFDPGIPARLAGRLRYLPVTHTLQMNGYWDTSVYEVAQHITTTPGYTQVLQVLWSRLTHATKTPYANFGAASYDWSAMAITHTDPPDSGDAEVAELNAHVAIAVNTTFGASSSGSYFGNDVAGLEDHFRYDPDALFTPPDDPGADIYSLTEDIQWLRPAGLGGETASGGGHAWVVYGYNKGTDPDRQFAMNMGWRGKGDGWYTFDSVPFTVSHDMMTQIAPLNVRFVGAADAGDGSPDDPYQDIEEALGAAPDGATLIFKAGSYNTFSSAPLVINRPLTLKGYDATINSSTGHLYASKLGQMNQPRPYRLSRASPGQRLEEGRLAKSMQAGLLLGAFLMASLVGIAWAAQRGNRLGLAKTHKALILLALVAPLLVASVAYAQSGGNYDLDWSTIDGGGYTFSAGGSYNLGGTIGQSDVGVSSGGAYVLEAGFWGGTAPVVTPLVANFSARPRGGLAPLRVAFSEASAGGASGWLWDFGDTYSSTQASPTHVYAHTGAYTVSLKVFGSGGRTDALTRTNYILVTPLAVSQEITPANSGLYTFGDTCARLNFDDTGSLTAVTVTLIYTFPTAQSDHRPLPRRYDITGNGAGFSAALGLCYDEDDLTVGEPIGDENALEVYRYGGGGAWEAFPSIRDTSANRVTATHVTSFSAWAIGAPGNAPTIVSLGRLRPAAAGLPWLGALASVGLLCAAAWWTRRRRG